MNDSDARIADLRKRAEENIKSRRPAMEEMPVEDVLKLVEELQIHQVELEMQNEELRSMQWELEQSRKKYSDLYDFAPTGYFTINEEGRIVEANLTAAKQLGVERSFLIGKPFNLYAAEDYREELHLYLREVLKTGKPHIYEMRINGRSKVHRYVQLDSAHHMDSEGQSLIRTTMTDISDRKEAEEKLKEFSNKLEYSNRELEQFAFTASHDLQEPLRKIRAFGDLLVTKCGAKLDEVEKDYLTRMQNAAKRMEQFISDLLEYSRVATRPEALDTVNLRDAVMEVISVLELGIKRLGANVEVFELPAIKAQKSQVCQLFQNLIANALKFHGEVPPHIKIYSQRTDHDFRIFVEDNGIGFDEKYREVIFAPFRRLHGRSAYDGTGMGLAICTKIAERYGGSITAKSKPGEGSTFIITFPVKPNLL